MGNSPSPWPWFPNSRRRKAPAGNKCRWEGTFEEPNSKLIGHGHAKESEAPCAATLREIGGGLGPHSAAAKTV